MSGIVNAVTNALAEPVSPVLIHSLWQGLLIAVLLKAALTFVSARKARLRYTITTTALAALVALCVITGLAKSFSAAPTADPASAVDGVATILASDAVEHSVATPVPADDDTLAFLTPRQIERGLIPFWIGGILLLTLRHVFGYRLARRLARMGTSQVPAVWSQRFARICRKLEVSRSVRFLGSAIVKVPCVVGWFKPVVLFPISSLANLSVGDVEMILAHELAHIRRNDVLVNIAQVVIETLLFFNPAVWWISRQIRVEREHCCDDMAIALTGDRLDYARALVNLEESRQASGFAVAANATGIVARVRRIILHQSPRAQTANMGVIGMLLLAALLIAGVTTLSGPAATDVSAATTFESASTFEPQDDDLKGKWEIETGDRWSQVTISFKRNWKSSFSVKTDELLRDIDENTTDFQMVRDAGTFHFTGNFTRERDGLWGDGRCYFRPNPDYVARLASLGYDVSDKEDTYEFAMHDITLDYVQGMHKAGYDLTRKKLVEAHIHDVTPEFIAGLAQHGYKNLDIDRLIEMQIHDVDEDYIDGLASQGYTDIPPEKLVEMSIHDVDGDYVRGLASQGYKNLSPDKLVEMNIHDVDEDYVAGLASYGYTDIPPDKLVELSIHDIDGPYIKGLASQGYTDLEPSELVKMNIHDVTPAYVAGLAKLGYTGLSAEALVNMQIHDVSVEYIQGLQELGYKDLDPSELVTMSIHDIDPDYVAALQKLGYRDLSPKRLVELSIHDVEPSYIEDMNALGLNDISASDLVNMSIHDVTPRYVKDLIALGYDDLTPDELVDMQIHDVTPAFVERMQKREGKDLSPRDLIEYRIHGRW